ncbi:collagen-binding protein [Bacteroidia bacterium]|nr:collagen-binding protein [Bacteroidia bacterium]
MTKVSTLLGFLLLGHCLLAQNISVVRVVGSTYNLDEKAPLPFATVALYSPIDTSLVTGTTSELDGKFSIPNITPGNYILRVSSIGYGTVAKNITVTNERRAFQVGQIDLKAGIELDEFVVKATYIPVQMKEDTVEYSAEAFRAPEGSMLEDLLKRFPGAEVSADGKITVNGKDISKILVNGKKFFDDDPKVAAKNLPANMVDKVQVFDRSSDMARFSGIDDGESESVINLVVRKDMARGWFGRATAGGGMDMPADNINDHLRYENNLTLNYFNEQSQFTILGGLNNTNNSGFTDATGSGGQAMMVFGDRGRNAFGGSNGIRQSANIGINFSKKTEKAELGGDYQLGHTNNFINQDVFRENIRINNNNYYTEHSERRDITNQHRFRFELEYKLDSANEFTIKPNLTYSNKDYNNIGTYLTTGLDHLLINKGATSISEESAYINTNLELSYRHRFGKPRRTLWLSGQVGYNSNNGDRYNYSDNHYAIIASDTTDQFVDNASNRLNYRLTANYTEPLGKILALSLRYTYVQTMDNTDKQTFTANGNGLYNIVDSIYSTVYENRFVQHRAEATLQWKIRNTNYNFGLGLYPSQSYSTVEGVQRLNQHVLNFAPTFQIRYSPSRSKSLRIRYNGEANQPSMNQLQPVPDKSDPLDVKLGNPDLKPYFTHRLRLFYTNFNQQKLSSVVGMLFGTFAQNAITSVSITDPALYPELQLPDSMAPGTIFSRYENVDYTYNFGGNFVYTTPIKGSKFTFSTITGLTMTNSKSIIDRRTSTTTNTGGNEQLKLTYRREKFDFSVNGRLALNNANYSLYPEKNVFYQTVSAGMDGNWTIVKGVILSSDLSYNKTTGYADGYNPEATKWNAQISWVIGKSNQGIIRLRVTDLLNRNYNTVRNTTSTYIEDVNYNALGRYFILAFTYNLNAAKASEAPQREMREGYDGRPRMPMGVPPPGGGGQPVIIRN